MPNSEEGIVRTPPPYNMNLELSMASIFSDLRGKISTKYRSKFEDKMIMEDYYEFHKLVLTELIRTSRGFL